jgi:hypothetical protein
MNENFVAYARAQGLNITRNGIFADPDVDVAVAFEKYSQDLIQSCISKIALMGISNWQNEDISWATDQIVNDLKEKYQL